jgi:hypothetical protein
MAPVGSSFFTVSPVVPRGPEPELIAVWLVGSTAHQPESARPKRRPAGGGHMTKAALCAWQRSRGGKDEIAERDVYRKGKR